MQKKKIFKMKKILIILVALIGFGFSANAQQQKKTIATAVGIGYNSRGENPSQVITFSSNGDFYYSPRERSNDYRMYHKNGTYYIDEKNTVYITWENGFQETGQIQYENGRIVFYYNNLTFYQDPFLK